MQTKKIEQLCPKQYPRSKKQNQRLASYFRLVNYEKQTELLAALPIASVSEALQHIPINFFSSHQERCHIIYLDQHYQFLAQYEVARGTKSACFVSIQAVLLPVIQLQASYLICLHNHPRGNPKPSEEDRILTIDLIDATKLIECQVLDHVIFGMEKLYSFREQQPKLF